MKQPRSFKFPSWETYILQVGESPSKSLGSRIFRRKRVSFHSRSRPRIRNRSSLRSFYGDRVRLQNSRRRSESSSSYLTSLLHLHFPSTTIRKIAASTDDKYDEDDISEFEDMIAACESLLSILPIFFLPRPATFSLFRDDISSSNTLVDPITHPITGIVVWECVSATALGSCPGSDITRRTRGPGVTWLLADTRHSVVP